MAVAVWIALGLEGAILAWFEAFWDAGAGLASNRICWAAEWALWGGVTLGALVGYELQELPANCLSGRRTGLRARTIAMGLWALLLAFADSDDSPWLVCLVLTGGIAFAIGFHAAFRLWPCLSRGNADRSTEAAALIDDGLDGNLGGGAPPWRRT